MVQLRSILHKMTKDISPAQLLRYYSFIYQIHCTLTVFVSCLSPPTLVVRVLSMLFRGPRRSQEPKPGDKKKPKHLEGGTPGKKDVVPRVASLMALDCVFLTPGNFL